MIFAISAQKGGTAKTTTAHAMQAGLTLKGFKVLSVDLDQQGSLSFMAGADQTGKTVLGVLAGELKAEEAIQHLPIGDIIPANKKLAGAAKLLEGTGGEYTLKEALKPIKKDYDYIILDCPPALNHITINALTAADQVIIPAQADILSLQGISQLWESIQAVKTYTNKQLKVAGILLCRHNPRAVIKRDLEEHLRTEIAEQMHTKVFKTAIREAVAINEAQYMQQSIFDYAGKSRVAGDYKAFIKELLSVKEG